MDISQLDKIRSLLVKEENALGRHEIDNFIISRKYLINNYDPYIRLYFSSIKSNSQEEAPIAKICFVHGFGHHSFDFLEIALYLAQHGINCYMVDLRGHGLSGGVRCDYSIEDLHSDVITMIKESEKESFDLPLFILGHSMGGGCVTSLFINNPYLQIHGVILSAPLLGQPAMLPEDPVKNFVLRNMGSHLRDFIVGGFVNPTALTKVDKEVVRMINDSKNIPMANPNTFKNIMKMYTRILENCRNFSLPCLIIHGDQDKLCNVQHSKIFFENIRR